MEPVNPIGLHFLGTFPVSPVCHHLFVSCEVLGRTWPWQRCGQVAASGSRWDKGIVKHPMVCGVWVGSDDCWIGTVDGQNPALRMMIIPLFTWFYTSQMVQDFVHQQYELVIWNLGINKAFKAFLLKELRWDSMKFLSAFGDRSSTSSLMATLRRRKIKPVKMNHCIIIDVKYSLIPRWFDLGGLQFYFEHIASSDLKVVAS